MAVGSTEGHRWARCLSEALAGGQRTPVLSGCGAPSLHPGLMGLCTRELVCPALLPQKDGHLLV